MSHVLITFLGKGENGINGLYKPEQYHFENDNTPYETNFFGLAVLQHLVAKGKKPDKLVVLGTPSSMWNGFYELDGHVKPQHEEAWATLGSAIEENTDYPEDEEIEKGKIVEQLAPLKNVLSQHLDGITCELRVISYGEKQEGQTAILKEMADCVEENDTISLDITHGSRHLPILVIVSANYLKVVKKVHIESIYYGAMEMKNRNEDIVPALTLIDIAKLEEQEKANQELEQINQELKEAQQDLKGIMGMFAHKFRGPLQSIKYNAEHENQQKFTLQAVQTMAGLLNIFSVIAMDSQVLRKKLQQDMQGDGTLVSVLEKALLLVLSQLLTIGSAKRIRQHYLYYAKKTGQVPSSTTREQWEEDYDLEEQLQATWEDSFSTLLTEPGLDKLVAWLAERFFPLEVSGFNDDVIHFEQYGTTESILVTVMTEILLNAVKYYSSETNQPVKISWQRDKDFCRFICENPSHRKERRIDKGSKKGQKFLSMIARNLQGQFPQPLPKNAYWVELHLPTNLFVKEKI
jgi:CRISPR-associated Csx2 family protein